MKRRYIRRKYAVKNPVEDATGNIVIAEYLIRYLKPTLRLVYWGLFVVFKVCVSPAFYRKIELLKRQFGWEESPIKVLEDNKPESTHRGFMWVYRHPINNLVLFDYRKGRGKSGHKERLSSFKGIIQ